MKKFNVMKKGITTALLATMVVTGVSTYSANAEDDDEERFQAPKANETSGQYDERIKKDWEKEFKRGEEDAKVVVSGNLNFNNQNLTELFKKGSPLYNIYLATEHSAFEQGFTKTILEHQKSLKK